MELKVNRYKSKNKVTIGELWMNGKFFCMTLEDEIRPLLDKIFGGTAIPSGKYTLAMTYSNRFQQYMPQVLNVPGFEGIRIHPGNTIADTNGCLLIGETANEVQVFNSKDAFNKLIAEIKTVEKSEKITIKYINTNKDYNAKS